MSIVDPRLSQLLEQVDSRYALVNAASKRARQINSYYRSGGGAFSDETAPMVDGGSKHELSIAFEEIAQGKLLVKNRQRGSGGDHG